MLLKKCKCILTVIYILFKLIICTNGNYVYLNTPQGRVKGYIGTTIKGRGIEYYTSIPYAQPPLNTLRFQDPVPFGKWQGEFDATHEVPKCVQRDFFYTTDHMAITGDEDCLYLNVYTPSAKIPGKYPVMAYIHGGGFTCGSSTHNLYGPQFLLDKDVVLVTFNYRLGSLGFLSLENDDLPGNYGLKDQVLALKWIQENIASYGGNPNSVTLFGQSAGAASVHLQMVFPESQGLFHRAIIMSGSYFCPWAIDSNGKNKEAANKLAYLVNCPSQPTKQLIECLRSNSSAYDLIDNLLQLKDFQFLPIIPFGPVDDSENSKNKLFPSNQYNIKTNKPMMIGYTKNESSLVFSALVDYSNGSFEKILEEQDNNFELVSRLSICAQASDHQTCSKEIRKFYLGDKKINTKSLVEYGMLLSDGWFTSGADVALRNNEATSYYYLFGYENQHSTSYILSNTKDYFGPGHSDDLMYLFPMVNVLPDRTTLTNEERAVIEKMVTLWTNFAIYENPTPVGEWKNFDPINSYYLSIEGESHKLKKDLFSDRLQFWRNNNFTPKPINDPEKDEF